MFVKTLAVLKRRYGCYILFTLLCGFLIKHILIQINQYAYDIYIQ